jgi:hypothetical protein
MIEVPLQLKYIRYWRIETWTAIVVLIALVQPWVVALYRRVLRSGRLEIYETGLPEIGYRSRDRELLVKSDLAVAHSACEHEENPNTKTKPANHAGCFWSGSAHLGNRRKFRLK